MKKQILAVAVAGAFAVPAFAAADTNVTLFGQLQTQVVHHSASGDSGFFNDGFRVHDGGAAGNFGDGANPNRIGVMINHDLGNGLTALAKIEQNVTTGDGFQSSARDVYVGLDGNFGRVLAGRMASPYVTAGKDPLNATFMQARTQGGRLPPLGGLGEGSYLDNGLAYSNSFGMVSLNVAAFVDNGDDSNTAFAGRLNFDLGPVDLYVAHNHADDYVDHPIGGQDFRASKIGADWRSGPFRLVGEVTDFKWEDAAGDTAADGNTYFLSGTYTMGRNDFVLNLGHTNLDGGNNTDYAAIAVKHNFSNRVMAFAGVGYNSTDNSTLDAEGDVIADTGSLSFTGVGGGMRVSF
ncbi:MULTISPECIES: porin [unclassified Thioalkalivibrio]|uniref:porin n=1 Tax=unclassified Thioalkalivibrio TaxID=2621013 RepID=UPI0003716466|nr:MULTISPECIES: porin [unclassified Thioalkalivibrio]